MGMKIAGLQRFTLIDYPDKIACTVFSAGCDFRCPFCHNPELVLPEKIKEQPHIPEKEFFNFLKERKELLEGCVLCGGEPTINKDLPQFCKKIKRLDYLIKLDTNGSNPTMLQKLIDEKLIDYVAIDIKAPREKYSKLAGREVNVGNIEKSIKVLKQSGMDFEMRTTVVPGLLKKEDILKIAKWIGPAPRYILQNFRSAEKTIDPRFEKIKPYPQDYLLEIQKAVSPFFEVCQIR